MAQRFYTVFVWTAWLASMSWLFVAKIWPTLHGGHPPDYSIAGGVSDLKPVVWRISWNDRRIGTAASQKLMRANGAVVRHVVQFEHVPLDVILTETLGPLGGVFKSNASGPPLDVEMLLATQLRFNQQRQFTGFHTIGDWGSLHGVFNVQGHVNERRKLQLRMQIGDVVGGAQKSLRYEVDLPPNAVINDAFAPRPELRNLQVGQRWTIPVYRPFPPKSPVQIIAAHAERHELILWDGRDVETVLVVYRSDAGSGLGATQEPVAREWVREDGLVLQNEVYWSNATIRFERLPEVFPEPLLELLGDEKQPRLWSVKEAP